jgi:divalent metal cation (Fe/Co/Zn/Cd) transporter
MSDHSAQAPALDFAVAAEPEQLRAAWRVSLLSIVWTVLASVAAVAVGVASGSGVLVAFGAVGVVDAIGSAALTYHFGHAIRNARISHRLETIAHRVVVFGLLTVGLATIVVEAARLVVSAEAEASVVGARLAAVSLLVLTVLSVRKHSIARRVSSPALRADSHLSAVGATLAAITLAGTQASQRFGWHWADATAAIAVGCVAVILGLQTALTQRRRPAGSRASCGSLGQ